MVRRRGNNTLKNLNTRDTKHKEITQKNPQTKVKNETHTQEELRNPTPQRKIK